MRVVDVMRASSVSVGKSNTPRAVIEAMERAGVDELPVADADGRATGMIERRLVERCLYDRGDEDAPASSLAEDVIAYLTRDEPIEQAADMMLDTEEHVLPVLSEGGRLEGLLVLDDLRAIPDLLDEVIAVRRERAAAAGAATARVTLGCALVSAALGLVLFAMWIGGPTYGLPGWVTWADGIAALLALVAAVAAPAREMFSIPLWAVTGVGLCFAAAVGHAWHDSRWATWVQLLFGVMFLLLTAVIGAAMPARRHARRMSLAGEPR